MLMVNWNVCSHPIYSVIHNLNFNSYRYQICRIYDVNLLLMNVQPFFFAPYFVVFSNSSKNMSFQVNSICTILFGYMWQINVTYPLSLNIIFGLMFICTIN